MNSLTILVMGKGGVGKSSTVNSIIGERVVSISPFQVGYDMMLNSHGYWVLISMLSACLFGCVGLIYFFILNSRKGQGR